MSESHPSDLAIDRLFAGEREAAQAWRAHIHRCDDCWSRWVALHEEAGRRRPLRGAAPTRTAPMWFGGGLIAGALAAVALLAFRAPPAQEMEQLRQEVTRLRLENETIKAETQGNRDAQEAVLERGAPEVSGSIAPEELVSGDDIPPDVLERAVEREILRRTAQKIEREKKRNAEEEFMHLGEVIDALVADGVLDDDDAGEVESLLQGEIEDTWEIKGQVAEEQLTREEGFLEWEELHASTNDALDELVGSDTHAHIRALLFSEKGK